MIKFLFALLFVPNFSIAQQNKTDLSQYGLKASIETHPTYTIREILQEEGDIENKEIKIKYENGEKIVIAELRKPMTIAVVRNEFNKVLSKPNKSVTLKALVKTSNEYLVERTYKSDGRKIYKFMLLRAIKGKEYMIESSEFDDLALCKDMMALAKTFK